MTVGDEGGKRDAPGARPDLVGRARLEEYAPKYARNFRLERRDGILLVQMHSDGGPAVFSRFIHNAWPQLWMDIGNDPENEVLILSGSGDKWIGGYARDPEEAPLHAMEPDTFHDLIYADVTKSIESFIFNIDIPTIACINGPGFHLEPALLCDITLCADHAVLFDPHFVDFNIVPGDGQGLTFLELLGIKRAAYYLYTSERIDAQTAERLGLVNEVLALDALLPRAWDIAAKIMARPRTVRRFTSALIRRPWKRLLVQDLGFHVSHELLGFRLDKGL